jgi:hypothetical protein
MVCPFVMPPVTHEPYHNHRNGGRSTTYHSNSNRRHTPSPAAFRTINQLELLNTAEEALAELETSPNSQTACVWPPVYQAYTVWLNNNDTNLNFSLYIFRLKSSGHEQTKYKLNFEDIQVERLAHLFKVLI